MPIVRKFVQLSLLALAAVVLQPTIAAAELPDWAPKPPPRVIEDRFRFEVGVFNASVDTQLRIDESLTLRGTAIDAEDDLALDESEWIVHGELTLLPGKHHLLRLSALNTERSAHTVIDREIFFDDEVYDINERVDSEFNLSLFGLTYGYRLLMRERAELTATLGVQIASFDANVVARSRVVREAESGVAPVPLLGLEGRFDFTKRWSVEGRVQYLTVEIEEVEGSITDARLALTWRTNPHLVFGLGYRSFSIEVDSRDDGTPGFVDFQIAGPMLYMRASL